jgi:hypothetical protein
MSIAIAPDGRVFIVVRNGELQIFNAETNTVSTGEAHSIGDIQATGNLFNCVGWMKKSGFPVTQHQTEAIS